MNLLPIEIVRLTPVDPGACTFLYRTTFIPASDSGDGGSCVKMNQHVKNPISPCMGKVPQRKSADDEKDPTEHHQYDFSIL